MIRLYIENQEMDVTAGFSHQITYAVDDLQNLDSKATAFSKTIVLPGTAKNNYLLGNIFEFSNANFTGDGDNVGYNFNASKSAKCRLEINGLQIIKGVLRLMEIIRDDDSIEYEVAIFGELGGFFNSLGNKKLEDLDFSAYNHTYTVANITNRWDDKPDMIIGDANTDTYLSSNTCEFTTNVDLNTIIKLGDILFVKRLSTGVIYEGSAITNILFDGIDKNVITISTNWVTPPASTFKGNLILANKGGAGVYYPLIDYGNYSTNKKDYIYRTFRPALFLREYIHKIITGAGYTYESKFFDSDFFKRIIIPYNYKKLVKYTSYELNVSTASYVYQTSDGASKAMSFGILTAVGNFTPSGGNTIFTYSGANIYGKLDFRLKGIFSSSTSIPAEVKIKLNGTTVLTFGIGGYNAVTEPFDIKASGNISIANGDVLTVTIDKSGGGTWLYSFDTFLTNLTIISGALVPSTLSLNDLIYINDTIPRNILQKDFFASTLKMFYLMVTEDKYKDKHLHIEPYTWFYNLNSDTYIDWSMKLDRSQPIRIKPMSEINARFYEIKHKGDNDYFNEFYRKRYNQGYGDVRFDNELEFAKDSQTTEVIFTGTPLVGYNGESKIVPTIFKWDGKTIGVNEESVNSNIRIMQCKNITEVNSWSILNDPSGTLASGYTYYPYAGHFDDPDVPASDLNFGATKELFFSLSAGALGNNLFNTFYSSYLAEITDKDSRLVTAKFKLNDTDIFNLDFGRFIYLDGVLYRLSRVVDYTPGEICTVELLRVIYTTYDSSVNASDDPEININGQIWKLNNLNTSYYANGDEIPQITDASEWENATDGAWCYYANNTNNGIIYGKLYNWFAVNDPRGLAPDGWRVPTVADFTTLLTYTGGDMYKIKESGTLHWNTNNGTNDTAFTALGAGERDELGAFQYLKNKGRFWTSEEYDEALAFYSGLNDNSSTSQGDKGDKHFGFSVRLIKDV